MINLMEKGRRQQHRRHAFQAYVSLCTSSSSRNEGEGVGEGVVGGLSPSGGHGDGGYGCQEVDGAAMAAAFRRLVRFASSRP